MPTSPQTRPRRYTSTRIRPNISRARLRVRRLLALSVLAGSGALAATAVAPTAQAADLSTWDKVAACEATGNWSINTGNGFYGGLQFTASTWKEFGGHQYAPQAHQASKAQQVAIAEKVLKVQGPGAWPVCSVKAGLTRGGPAPQLDTSRPATTQLAPQQQAAPEGAPEQPSTVTYTVVQGDTITGIADHLATNWQELHTENHQVIGYNPNLIHPGQHLIHHTTTHDDADAPAAQSDAKAVTGTPESASAGKVSPIDGGRITAGYGQKGNSWSAGRHTGVDYAAPIGTPAHAITNGVVVSAGPQGAYGTTVTVKHTDGTYGLYAHLSKTIVTPGQTVTPGQVIALTGNSGNTTGPHLHLEVRTTNTYGNDINPLGYLAGLGTNR